MASRNHASFAVFGDPPSGTFRVADGRGEASRIILGGGGPHRWSAGRLSAAAQSGGVVAAIAGNQCALGSELPQLHCGSAELDNIEQPNRNPDFSAARQPHWRHKPETLVPLRVTAAALHRLFVGRAGAERSRLIASSTGSHTVRPSKNLGASSTRPVNLNLGKMPVTPARAWSGTHCLH
jgi:hypothetical protein